MKRSTEVLAGCLVLFFLALPVSIIWGQSDEGKIKLLTTETDFGKRHDVVGSWRNELVLSPDRKRLAYWAEVPKSKARGFKRYVVVNGVPGKPYDYTSVPNPRAGTDPPPGTILFSPNSRHIAYRALRGNHWLVVRDGKESKFYPEAEDDLYDGNGDDVIDDIIWSPNSQHLAFRARRNKKWRVVLDGKEGRSYDWIADNDLHFSSDSKRLAYWARRAGKNFLVVVEGAKVKETAFKPKANQSKSTPRSSAETTPTDQASIVSRDGKQAVLWNGQEGKFYDEIDGVTTGPNDQHLAYWAKRGGQWFIVVDRVEGKPYQDGAGPETTDMLEYDGTTIINNLDPLVFDGPQSLHTTALRSDGHIVLVEVKILDNDT